MNHIIKYFSKEKEKTNENKQRRTGTDEKRTV